MPDLLNSNFGLLLEYNCSQALTAREVNIGKSSKPYGIKTDFIWSIGGGSDVYSGMLFCPKATIRELPAQTVKDTVRILELDSKQNQGKGRILKNIMEKGIRKTENGNYEMT